MLVDGRAESISVVFMLGVRRELFIYSGEREALENGVC
jgi:hypothetical protein